MMMMMVHLLLASLDSVRVLHYEPAVCIPVLQHREGEEVAEAQGATLVVVGGAQSVLGWFVCCVLGVL